tara:strand:+ start:3745 stop:4215 length:471 start_codon:yes stop_codon:yes gene_type:complete
MMQHIPTILLLAVISLLMGCSGSGAPRLDLGTYSPVIDFYQYDTTQFNTDISQCRQLAITAQEKYDLQQAEERAEIFASAVVGAVVGAAVGNALDDNNDSATTTGAVYGAGLGAVSAAEGNDYNRVITKFGATAIVDRCMKNRGYQILSESGYGGG